jgi:hypothetical protein
MLACFVVKLINVVFVFLSFDALVVIPCLLVCGGYYCAFFWFINRTIDVKHVSDRIYDVTSSFCPQAYIYRYHPIIHYYLRGRSNDIDGNHKTNILCIFLI